MAVFNRYKLDFTSVKLATPYSILIKDNTLGSDQNRDFCSGAEGFTLEYPTEDKEFQDGLKPSSCTVNFLVQNATDELFIQELSRNQENRFFIEIQKNNVPYWRGVVVQDENEVENRPLPYFVQIKAVDGITQLKELSGDIIPPSPQYPAGGFIYTLLQKVIAMLNQTAPSSLYSANELFLTTGVRWFEIDMPNAVDPMANEGYVAQNIEWAFDKYGEKEYESYFDILDRILKLLNVRMIHTRGMFYILQTNELRFNNITIFQYSKSYELTSQNPNNAPNGVINVNASLPLKKPVVCGQNEPIADTQYVSEAGGIWQYLGAVKSVKVGYDVELDDIYQLTQKDISTLFNTGVSVQSVPNSFITFNGNIQIVAEEPLFTQSTSVTILTNLTIKIGANYWDGINGVWTTTQSIAAQFTKATLLNGNGQASATLPISLTTNFVPTAGVLELQTQSAVSGPGIYQIVSELTILKVEYSSGSNLPVLVGYTATNTNNEAKDSSLVIDLGDSFIGDKPNTSVNYRQWKTFNGAGFKNSEEWNINQVGNQRPINQLLVEEVARVRQIPIRKWEMNLIGDYDPFITLTNDGASYLFNGGKFIANMESWDAVWLEIVSPVVGTELGDQPRLPNNGGSLVQRTTSQNATTNIYGFQSYDDWGVANTTQVVQGTLNTINITPRAAGTILAGDLLTLINDFGQSETLTVSTDQEGNVLNFEEKTFEYVYPANSRLTTNIAQVLGYYPRPSETSFAIVGPGLVFFIEPLFSDVIVWIVSGTTATIPLTANIEDPTIFYNIKNLTGNNLVISTTAPELVDGATSFTLTPYENAKLKIRNSNYYIM